MQAVNNRQMPSSSSRMRREYSTPKNCNENVEIINYVFESWNQVHGAHKGGESSNVTYYTPKVGSDNKLANFTPFNLESWRAQQVVEKCSGSRNS